MNSDALTLPLLDFLQYRAGCAYLSDLRYIGGWQRLVRALEKIPAEAADLRAWNDALDYLAQAPPAETAETARARLIAGLTNHI